MPPWARPNAWLRCSGGAALTKAAAAASWKHANTPDTARIVSARGSRGPTAKSISTPHAAMASGPIHRSRRPGLTSRLKAMEPTMAPNASAASTKPTVAEPPPSERAKGAATPSGAL